MKTPEQLMNELDDRFDLLAKYKVPNVDSLNNISKINLLAITINRIEYLKKFREDELLHLVLERVKTLGRAVGIFVN